MIHLEGDESDEVCQECRDQGNRYAPFIEQSVKRDRDVVDFCQNQYAALAQDKANDAEYQSYNCFIQSVNSG